MRQRRRRVLAAAGFSPLTVLVALVAAQAAAPVAGLATALAGENYVVAKTGSDDHPGTADQPFLTISHAAKIAHPGDTITIEEGVYREWVDPKQGGASEDARIVYQAAEGADVRILGSEPAKGWVREGDIWRLSLPESHFGDFNPFALGIRHPIYVDADTSGDGWGWLRYGRDKHRGDVYFNGDGLTEKPDTDDLAAPMTWRTKTENGETHIWANFGDHDPNDADVELTMRPYGFFPSTPGLGYITLKGVTVMNVADHWAPPTVYQPGAVGANGGHHWIIEDNIILNARALCISLGQPTGEADQEQSGRHIVRRNIIMRCGQGGIAGEAYNSHSRIEDNHFEDINHRREFGGVETAAIKFHRAVGSQITGNFIKGVYTKERQTSVAHGIWIDYDNADIRISRNIVTQTDMFAVLLEANWTGRLFLDSNIILGGGLGHMSTQREVWAHNLFLDTYGFWQNQAFGDRPPLKEARWHNNLFIRGSLSDKPEEITERWGAHWYEELDEPTYRFSHNAYLAGSQPAMKETNGFQDSHATNFQVQDEDGRISLHFAIPEDLAALEPPLVDAAFVDIEFKDPDGAPSAANSDFYGSPFAPRRIGPFSELGGGENSFVVYEYPAGYARARALLGQGDK